MTQTTREELFSSLRERNRDVFYCDVYDCQLRLHRTSEKVVLVLFRKKNETDSYLNPVQRSFLRFPYYGDVSSLAARLDRELSSLREEHRVMTALGYKMGQIPLLDYYRPIGDVCMLLSRTMSEIQVSKQRVRLKRLSFNWKERSCALTEFPTQTGFDILRQSRYPKRKSLPLAAVDFERQCYEIDDLVTITDLLKRAMVDRRVLKSV